MGAVRRSAAGAAGSLTHGSKLKKSGRKVMAATAKDFFACVLLGLLAGPAVAQNAPGVTDTEIKVGQTMPYTGPVTAFSTLGKGEIGYFKMLNEQGGVNGRKINLISLDDGYAPPKTVEQTRRLVEQDGVAFLFSSIGTATNTAVQRYLNNNKVPQLYIGSGASKFGNYKEFPYTIGGIQGTFRAEARIYGRYILKEKPNAKIAILYQNDDYGRDYVLGLKDVLGDKYASMVKEATYEFTDATVDSQVVSLQGSGAESLIVAATPKFAAQAIRKVHDIGWKPMFFLSNVAIWISTVIEPAGPEKAVGIMSSVYVKDPADPGWDNDPGMKEWKAWIIKYMPEVDSRDQNYVNSYNEAMVLVQALKQAGSDLSRENIMKQALNIKDMQLPMMLPGIKVNTSPTDYFPIEDMQMMRFDGKQWVRFGDLLSGSL
jgi:branched-chain amino acid transport system substrate-binding protein